MHKQSRQQLRGTAIPFHSASQFDCTSYFGLLAERASATYEGRAFDASNLHAIITRIDHLAVAVGVEKFFDAVFPTISSISILHSYLPETVGSL